MDNKATTIEKIQEDNLTAVNELGNHAHEFRIFSDSLSLLFMEYIETCVLTNQEILIGSYDIGNIRMIIEFFNKLKYEQKK